jgi:ClpP class serine protease
MKASSINLLRTIASSAWFMDKASASAYLPNIVKAIKGDEPFTEEAPDPRTYIRVIGKTGNLVEIAGSDPLTPILKEKDSIVIIPVMDAIVKYDMPCGPVGTLTRAAQVKEASQSENVRAVVFLFDTPGGEAGATETLERAITECSKPTFGIVQGLMCSAGMWIGSACDELFISSETDIVGSIGTMITLQNFEGYFAKQGIKFHDIYADASKHKNKDYHEAMKGNYKPIKQNLLNPLNDVFKATVVRNRPNLNKSSTLSGKTFIGSQAIKQGLVDGKTTLELLIKDIMFGTKFRKLEKFSSKKKLDEKDLSAIEKILAEGGITGIRIGVPASLLLEAAEGPAIFVYAEEGEDLIGKQCVYADESGEPTEDNVEDGEHELADGRLAATSTHDDGKSYIDSIDDAPAAEEEEEEEEEEKPKPGSKVKTKATAKVKAKATTKASAKLSTESRAIMAAVKGMLAEQNEAFTEALEEIRSEITSDGDVVKETNINTGAKGKTMREQTGMSAIQRKQQEIRERNKK